uniref:Doublecortin domain-containing protein n=1 Tax=Ditylenchus dipsaci TaxID=166011 RepID=A0A915DLG1_9BILA
MVEDGSPNKRVKRKKKKVVDDLENNKQVVQAVRKVNSNRLASRTPEVAKRIRVYRNGDAYHKGINFVLNMRQEHTIHTFLDIISEKIGLIKGAKRLYTVDGDLIRSTHDLLNNNEYVASSGPFLPLPYGKVGTGTRRASFSATNGPRKEGTSFTLNSTPKQTTSMPAPSRPSRSLEPKNRAARQKNGGTLTNGYLKGTASPAGRKPKEHLL